jgi:hypothetical protein
MDGNKNLTNISNESTEKDQISLENRTKILVDEACQVFNRFLSNVDSLVKKIISLFQMFLVLISIEIAIITFHLQNGFVLSNVSRYLLYLICFLGFLSFVVLVYLVYPKWFKDVSIFEEKRFNELCVLDEMDLLSDYLYNMKTSYQFNVPIYNKITKGFYIAYVSVVLMTMFFVILIINMRTTAF